LEIEYKYHLSVITIVYNGDKFIEQTVKSVLSQKNSSIQYIVIDGGSIDKTKTILNKYRDEIDILISEPDDGIYNAINKGITSADGKYITLLHCGDYYDDNILEYISSIAKLYNFSVLYSDIYRIEDVGSLYVKKRVTPDHKLLTKKMSIFHPSTLVLNEVYKLHGQYSEDYKLASDYDFFLKLYINGVEFKYIPICFVNFRTDGISSKSKHLSLQENFKIRQKRLGILKATIYFLNASLILMYYELRKKIFILSFGEKYYNRLKIRLYKNE